MHIQTQRHNPIPPEQAKSRIKKGSPTPPGGEQDGEATSGCGDTQMVNKTLLPQRPRDAGADMGTHTSRTIITKPPDAQTGGWTYMHTDTYTQTQALGRSNTQAQDSCKTDTEHPGTQTSRYRETQTYRSSQRLLEPTQN